ncbi:uncharacterized protein DDB_G0283697 isoform X3 [Rosa chinensis]|uniref:uncharacterized protein DDB_G0283697 isoform X3 n=1 Tax=Rosa chinensis TaxID=74649 RepID=UPI000D09244E|nr:uncharacterized protein DDB_G0283697 isoform X3 [Rosa chinensis]
MPKHSDPSDEETPEDSSSGSEEQNPQDGGVPEYEKQRQARIAHNRARMEALGLPKIASSLMGSAQNATKRKRKGKAKVLEEDDDDEYRPEEASSSEDEANDEDFEDEKSSSARKKKNKGSKPKKARSRRSSLSNSDYLDDDDEALKQAIALSLQDSAVSGVVKANVNERKGENQIQQDSGRKRKNSQFASRLQMTEDEFVLHFFQFDAKS